MAKAEIRVTDDMIQAACLAGYGVGADKGSNFYRLMKRAIAAALNARPAPGEDAGRKEVSK